MNYAIEDHRAGYQRAELEPIEYSCQCGARVVRKNHDGNRYTYHYLGKCSCPNKKKDTQ